MTDRQAEAYIPQVQIPLDSTPTLNISDNHIDSTEICIAIEKMYTFCRNEKFRERRREIERERERERERKRKEKRF